MSRSHMQIGVRTQRVRDWWVEFTVPAASGLPRRGVLLTGLLSLLVVFLVLVATAINGTSSGAFFPLIYSGADPALLFGQPNLIRTDEWNVQTVWAITQVQQGLPALNGSFPGGMDSTIPQDLPRLDWTVAFRPHLWGFLFLDVDHAQAWKWWSPVFGLAAATWTFIVSLLPRRPLMAMVLAIAFTASPFFAWWLLQTTLWPVAWGFAVLAAAIWAARSTSRTALWVWRAVVGYLTVVVGMGIYVPFIIPVALVAAFVVTGIAIEASRSRGWATVVRRFSGLVIAGLGAGVILVLWIVTRWDTVDDFLSTAYPGERLEPTGGAANAQGVAAVFGSSFTNSLRHAGTFLNGNASESATFFLPGVFLGAIVLWLAVRERRAGRALPWSALLGYGAVLLLLAFIFVPGWDAVAHALFLDRSTSGRARIGLGFGSMVIVVLLLSRISPRSRPSWLVSSIGPVVFLASQAAIAIGLGVLAPDLLRASGVWWFYAVLGSVAILSVARGWRVVTATALLLISVAATYNVNPVYVGVFDLRTTQPAQTIEALDDAAEGTWVGLGGGLPTALLLESGATSFNGFQGAPGEVMWEAIDPAGAYELEWDRLAGVSWVNGEGEPTVMNPYPDQIRVTFDPCSEFAQENVDHVVSDQTQVPNSSCLRLHEEFRLNGADLKIWQVIPKAG
ncbi:DUF7657 domain-containing protein [Microbacterium memoriense]|uniref:Glycosyltransferase RgtA/B/C/D-like domain-containing protein n=1 Tax=Microbacterium memoriense TaxID=2978350 RepID=A0ABT2PED6_9MICO|nr:hypothetical protein [Microbacterium memoriense]MCT9002799.1 hypothetical protein [Microbacterium memoriense]